jgi:hypothetical protein
MFGTQIAVLSLVNLWASFYVVQSVFLNLIVAQKIQQDRLEPVKERNN